MIGSRGDEGDARFAAGEDSRVRSTSARWAGEAAGRGRRRSGVRRGRRAAADASRFLPVLSRASAAGRPCAGEF
ncbi:hypothetical protein B5F40_11715 [Gordonibacter sp. An230]|nr:hypothetical protein B5F40_11715 [Gordonibacter sp. An230]